MIEGISYRGSYNAYQSQFQCTSLSDINNLPTQTKTYKGNTASTGSLALVEEDFSIWILTISGEWVKWV